MNKKEEYIMSIVKGKVALLAHMPTPLHYLPGLSQDLFREFYIKRDDLTPFGGGGNKLRKLEYLMFEAQSHEASTVITTGGVQTNHGRLTAAVAAKYGLKCIIVCIGTKPEEMSANLLLDGIFGARVVIKKDDGRDKDIQTAEAIAAVKAFSEKKGETVYVIPMGGSNTTGLLGYVDCAQELDDQAKAMHIDHATVYTAVGSMGTYLGLYCGLKAIESNLKLCGIAILPFGEKEDARLHEYFREAKDEYGFDFDDSDFHIETGYVRGGYNEPDEAVRDAIYTMARTEGVLLDPCYTGKMFAGVLDMIKERKIKMGRQCILMHTGGFPGLYTTEHRRCFEGELDNLVTVID
jgi:D-cysteine desulfhydrase family pyridoxal phosphate-dependent enzyme